MERPIMAKAKREPSTASEDRLLLHLCTLWHRQYLATEVCGADDELVDHRGELLAGMERHIARTKARTPAGLFAKLAIYENHLLTTMDPQDPEDHEQLALSLIGDVRRLVTR
jgi:hypothetical protein